MSGNNPANRVSILKQINRKSVSTSGRARVLEQAKPVGLPGWERLGEFLYRRREYITLDFSISSIKGVRKQPDLLFYDTETTGLSSGTGTFIFLLGMARLEGKGNALKNDRSFSKQEASRIILEQIFTADYPGEPEFLNYIDKRFKEAELFVSFNGKSYDSHLLRTRFLMNGMEFEPGEQYDLLHVSRRLWGRLIGSCSLNNIEEKILGISRTGDLPGYEVPERYFSFLRTGNSGLLSDVFKHNRQDVISLVVLVNIVEKILSGESTDIEFDYTSLGAYLSGCDDLQKAALGEEHLNSGFARGDARAGRILSLIHKRNRRWERAVEVWHKMAEKKSFFAAIELAKYYEHKKQDYNRALMWVNKCMSWNIPLSTYDRHEIIRRKNRLLTRIKNRKF